MQQTFNIMPQELDYFFQLSHDLLCILSEDGVFERVNPAWEEVLGLTETQLSGMPLMDLVHPGDRPLTENQLQNLLATKLPTIHPVSKRPITIAFENRCRCADGSYRLLAWNTSFFPDHNQIYAVVQDIREAKGNVVVSKQQPTLATNDLRHRYLVENIKDYAMYLLDPEGRILTWNQGAERITGYSEAEVIGQSVLRLYTAEDIAAQKLEQELAIAAATGKFEDENWRVGQDGTQFWVHAVTTSLKDPDGGLLGFARIVRDVTECHMAEIALQQAYHELENRVEERTKELWRKNKQLEQAHSELQQLNSELVAQAQELTQAMYNLKQTQLHLIQSEKMSSLGQLVAGVAHEINNPVNFIYGNLEHASHYLEDLLQLISLYQQAYPQPTSMIQAHAEEIDLEFVIADLPKLLHSMKIGADRIRQIVLSLRNFSRLDESETKPVNIHDGIDSTLLILQNRLKAKPDRPEIQVVKKYASLPEIECYPGQLNQVFMNILSNAIDALEDRVATSQQEETSQLRVVPMIQIWTKIVNHDSVAIHLSDNGMGIPEKIRRKLFDPFFTTKPVGKGTGLGLSISYQIVVEKHKGQLHCLSISGKGTEFIIQIPMHLNN